MNPPRVSRWEKRAVFVQVGSIPCAHFSIRQRNGLGPGLTFRLQSSSSVPRRVRLRRPNWTKIEIKKSSKTSISHTVGRQVRRQPSGNIWRVSTRYGHVRDAPSASWRMERERKRVVRVARGARVRRCAWSDGGVRIRNELTGAWLMDVAGGSLCLQPAQQSRRIHTNRLTCRSWWRLKPRSHPSFNLFRVFALFVIWRNEMLRIFSIFPSCYSMPYVQTFHANKMNNLYHKFIRVHVFALFYQLQIPQKLSSRTR